MKQSIIFFTTILTLIITSCKSPVEDNNNSLPYEPEPFHLYAFEIVKYDKPEYIKNVIVLEVEGKMSWNWGGAASIELRSKVGENPYVELGDGYYINNWYVETPFYYVWDYIYPCLIDKTWEELKLDDREGVVKPMDDAKIIMRNPASELYYIDYSEIDAYFGTKLADMFPERLSPLVTGNDVLGAVGIRDSVYMEERYGEGAYHECIDVCTKIGEQYIEYIKQLYESGELLKIARRSKYFYYHQL